MAITMDIDSINEMNIILNDGDCGDILFEVICNKLKEYGLEFEISNNEDNINQNNSLVITIDQQYSSGTGTIIFAPYNNTRLGCSDSLTLSMQAAFLRNGLNASNILCGKVGYREDHEGNISRMIPTKTEDMIDDNYDTSFVVISLGTQCLDGDLIADSIIEGLVRQRYYLDNYDSKADLIYRADSGESVAKVAEYFGASADELNNSNDIIDRNVLEAQTIISPDVKIMDVFSTMIDFKIEKVKGKAL